MRLYREVFLECKNEHMNKGKHLDLPSARACEDPEHVDAVQKYSLTSTLCIDRHINLLTVTTDLVYQCMNA